MSKHSEHASDFSAQVPGTGPVVTFGKPSEAPARVWLRPNDKTDSAFFALWLQDGTWEMELKEGRVRVVCDTQGIKGKVLGQWFQTAKGLIEVSPDENEKVTMTSTSVKRDSQNR